jgi:phosphatidylserine/phosphatidylglycerophosphate/cardiolipin synthase-like enzyme
MANDVGQVIKDMGDLRVVAYPGDNMVLLAMSVADNAVNAIGKNLAGFAIWRTAAGKAEEALLNRLSFDAPITADTVAGQHKWTASAAAPFQKFRWVDVPPEGFAAPITYRVMAKYFAGTDSAALVDGPQATLTVEPPDPAHAKFRIAFTAGYASSQAYAAKFHNADIRPKGPKKAQFDTKPFQAQYEWLGRDARKHLFAFIDDCRKDKTAKVDVFAYDLDEPDVVAALCEFGKEGRLRAILDNAPLHTKIGAVEIEAAKLIKAATGQANVKQGHFSRFQHNKVLIKRDAQGKAQKVLFGSMNFSLRGLYVQANNVMVVDDPTAAGYFAAAFDNAFTNDVKTAPFAASDVAKVYNAISARGDGNLPKSAVALSPHSDAMISLGTATDVVRNAQSSVLYAVMAPTGGGGLLGTLKEIAKDPLIFSYGTVETDSGLAVQSGDGAMGDVTPFGFLKDKVPPPFDKEWSGGAGIHIHHKFIVTDFNGDRPTVFTGSSNLASGGEVSNGDSLIQIEDPVVASLYAIEAVRLFDHYTFRRHQAKATKVEPLSLWYPGKPNAPDPWWKTSYDKSHIKYRDRLLFADLPLPPDLQSLKKVDWSSLDALAARRAKKTGAKAKGGAGSRAGRVAGTKQTTRSKKKAAKKTAKKATKKAAAKATNRKSAPRRKQRRKQPKPAKKAASKKKGTRKRFQQ